MDSRLKLLSYSSIELLHSCPRKYQLKRLNAPKDKIVDEVKEKYKNITFDFGHAIGLGIQEVLAGTPRDEIIWKVFLAWESDLIDADTKKKKSFVHAILAIDKFIATYNQGFLSEYELLQYKGKPAVELSFCISLFDDFKYRGFIDAVLQHKEKKTVTVLEVKTTSITRDMAYYKNSAQALGYSTVLDAEYKERSDFSVLYIEYNSVQQTYQAAEYVKDKKQRTYWISDLMLDVETIKMFEDNRYPMRGSSCFSWNTQCEYFGVCTLETNSLLKGIPEPELNEEFQININLMDLIKGQEIKNESI